jgi:uncharacterized protein
MSAQFNFEWDPVKAKENLKKHGVSFEYATSVFRDPKALSFFDGEHSDDEERWTTLGKSDRDLLVIIHTFREISPDEFDVRLISARRATRKEQKQYEIPS